MRLALYANVVAFITCSADKAIAKLAPRSSAVVRRVPESVLISFCLVGGGLGFGASCILFNHKLKKGPFLIKCLLAYLVYIFTTCLF